VNIGALLAVHLVHINFT